MKRSNLGKSGSDRKKQTQILRCALFGQSVSIRMQALLLLAQGEVIDGGWLLETVLKFENLSDHR